MTKGKNELRNVRECDSRSLFFPVIPEFFLKEKISGILLLFMSFKILDKFRSGTPKFSRMTKENKEPRIRERFFVASLLRMTKGNSDLGFYLAFDIWVFELCFMIVSLDLELFFLCPGRESNPHGLPHTILSRARLPFRHLGKLY